MASSSPAVTTRNGEVNDDELDFVASLELNPQKSRVLLSRIQAMFREY
jgi:hypothetical protein